MLWEPVGAESPQRWGTTPPRAELLLLLYCAHPSAGQPALLLACIPFTSHTILCRIHSSTWANRVPGTVSCPRPPMGAAPTLPAPTRALRMHKFQVGALKCPRRRVVVFVCDVAYHRNASCLSLAARPRPAVRAAPLPGTAELPAPADKDDGWGRGWLHHGPAASWEPEPAQRSLSPEECVFEGWRASMGCERLPAQLSLPPALTVGIGTTRMSPGFFPYPRARRAGRAAQTQIRSLWGGWWW